MLYFLRDHRLRSRKGRYDARAGTIEPGTGREGTDTVTDIACRSPFVFASDLRQAPIGPHSGPYKSLRPENCREAIFRGSLKIMGPEGL